MFCPEKVSLTTCTSLTCGEFHGHVDILVSSSPNGDERRTTNIRRRETTYVPSPLRRLTATSDTASLSWEHFTRMPWHKSFKTKGCWCLWLTRQSPAKSVVRSLVENKCKKGWPSEKRKSAQESAISTGLLEPTSGLNTNFNLVGVLSRLWPSLRAFEYPTWFMPQFSSTRKDLNHTLGITRSK